MKIQRHPNNPVLRSDMVPYESSLVFNAGVIKDHDAYVMIFRNDYGYHGGNDFDGTNIGIAHSPDGIHWTVDPEPCFDLKNEEIWRAYDPRLTLIDGLYHMTFAVDTEHGIRGGIAVSEDLRKFEIVSMSVPDNRNMVLFPEKINGLYYRLERPFPVYGRGNVDRFDIWCSSSPDLVHWGNSELVLGVEDVPFADDKIGPAAPPIRTPYGWLTTFHGVDLDKTRGKNGWEECWQKRYHGGIMLLDLEEPWKVIGMCDTPLLTPEASYEREGGFRNDVIFPTGMVMEDNQEVKIYYGAADTYICLATAQMEDLVDMCLGKKDRTTEKITIL